MGSHRFLNICRDVGGTLLKWVHLWTRLTRLRVDSNRQPIRTRCPEFITLATEPQAPLYSPVIISYFSVIIYKILNYIIFPYIAILIFSYLFNSTLHISYNLPRKHCFLSIGLFIALMMANIPAKKLAYHNNYFIIIYYLI